MKKITIEVQYWKSFSKYFIYAEKLADIYVHIGYLYQKTCETIINISWYPYDINKDADAQYLRPDLYEIYLPFNSKNGE